MKTYFRLGIENARMASHESHGAGRVTLAWASFRAPKLFTQLSGFRPDIQHHAKVIHDESFHECTATLQVWGAVLHHIQQQGVDASISTEIPDFIASFFKKAIDAGYGQDNVMSLVKVLRS
jgi:hypothetical protein